jgi:hypothetical protein
VPPEEEALPKRLVRSVDHPTAGIRLDRRQPRQMLTYDLQADVASGAFSNGAQIEVTGQEGQEPLKLFHDRDVRVSLVKAEKGTITFATTVTDFHNLPLEVDTDPQGDTHMKLTASVIGNVAQSSVDGLHAVPIIFDRLSPEIRDERLAARIIDTQKDDPKPQPVVVRLRATDNEGVGMKRVRAVLIPRGSPVEPKPEDGVEIDSPPDSVIQIELPPPPGLQPGLHEFRVQLEPIDLVDRLGKKALLDVTLNVIEPKAVTRGSLKPTFSKEANDKAQDLKEKAKLKAQQQALQPAGGSGS